MLNVNELENKWRTYKIKKYIPYISIIISLILISTILFSIFNKKKFIDIKQENTAKKTVTNKKRKEKSIVIIDKNITNKQIQTNSKIAQTSKQTIPNEEKKLTLVPSLHFIKEIKNNLIPSYNKTNNLKSKKSNAQKAKNKSASEKSKLMPKLKIKTNRVVIKKTENKTINIKRQNSYEDINHVIQRFKKNNNPALSLFIAKNYYELKEYRNSYNYALITNKINNNIEASWLIFAKSLVKLNNKQSAIKILKQYIKYSKSNQAEILLNEIKTGKFK